MDAWPSRIDARRQYTFLVINVQSTTNGDDYKTLSHAHAHTRMTYISINQIKRWYMFSDIQLYIYASLVYVESYSLG